MTLRTRRQLLRAAGSAASLGLAGCLDDGASGSRFELTARGVNGRLTDRLRWRARPPFAAADRRLLDRLIAEGSLTTLGFAVVPPAWERPRYVERDGTYYAVTVKRTGTVERERWILWFDLLEGRTPPAGAEVYTSSLGTGEPTDLESAYGLSDLDVRAVEAAEGELAREGSFHDPEGDPPGRRGHVFLRRDAEETALLPEPPFTHVAFETSDGTRYGRAVAERATVELRRFEYAVRAVADSPAGFADHVREQHLRATFERETLPRAQRELLDAVTGGRQPHVERPPLSEAFVAVLSRLGLRDLATPEPGRVAISDEPYFRYDGALHTAQLQVFR